MVEFNEVRLGIEKWCTHETKINESFLAQKEKCKRLTRAMMVILFD